MNKVPFGKLIFLMLSFKMTNEEINTDLEKNRQLFPLPDTILNSYRETFLSKMSNKERTWYDSAGKIEFKDMPEFYVTGCMNAVGAELPYRRRPLFKDSLYLFSDPDLRTIIQAYIILRKSTKQIAASLTKFSKYDTTEEVVNMYTLMFCNMEDMDFSSWKEYIGSLPQTSRREAAILRDSFTKPPEYVQWRLGMDVDFATELDLIRDVMTTSFVQFKETINSNNPNIKATALNWADRFIVAADRYGKNKDTGDNDLQTEFRVYLQKLAPNVKHISEVDKKQLLESADKSIIEMKAGSMLVNEEKEQRLLEEQNQIKEYFENEDLT